MSSIAPRAGFKLVRLCLTSKRTERVYKTAYRQNANSQNVHSHKYSITLFSAPPYSKCTCERCPALRDRFLGEAVEPGVHHLLEGGPSEVLRQRGEPSTSESTESVKLHFLHTMCVSKTIFDTAQSARVPLGAKLFTAKSFTAKISMFPVAACLSLRDQPRPPGGGGTPTRRSAARPSHRSICPSKHRAELASPRKGAESVLTPCTYVEGIRYFLRPH